MKIILLKIQISIYSCAFIFGLNKCLNIKPDQINCHENLLRLCGVSFEGK